MTAGAPPLPPGRYVDLPGRGTTFARTVEGPPGAPTLLLLHGWTASLDLNFFSTFEALGREFNVLALDHRGHSRGMRTHEPFRLKDCADDAAALCAVLGLTEVIACGYSMGGPIAQLLWRRHRSLVGGLVLAATTRNFASSARQRSSFEVMGLLGRGARLLPTDTVQRVGGRILERRTGRRYDAWALTQINSHDWRSILEAGRELGRFDSRNWVGGIDVPTSVIITTRDTLVSPIRQAKLAAAIPGAAVYQVDCGHDGIVTEAESFVPVLLDACRSVSRRVSPLS